MPERLLPSKLGAKKKTMSLTLEQLEEKTRSLVLALENEVDDASYLEDVRQLVSVREWKVAVEILCELLQEEGWPLSESSLHKLAELAAALGVGGNYWQPLLARR